MKPVTEDFFFDDALFSSVSLLFVASRESLTYVRMCDSRGEYASKLAYHFPRVLQDAARAPDPVDLYRRTLSGAQDGSITIVSIGFFDNLAALLDSELDSYSNLTGKELIATKVKDLVVMGGDYPRYQPSVSCDGKRY